MPVARCTRAAWARGASEGERRLRIEPGHRDAAPLERIVGRRRGGRGPGPVRRHLELERRRRTRGPVAEAHLKLRAGVRRARAARSGVRTRVDRCGDADQDRGDAEPREELHWRRCFAWTRVGPSPSRAGYVADVGPRNTPGCSARRSATRSVWFKPRTAFAARTSG